MQSAHPLLVVVSSGGNKTSQIEAIRISKTSRGKWNCVWYIDVSEINEM